MKSEEFKWNLQAIYLYMKSNFVNLQDVQFYANLLNSKVTL